MKTLISSTKISIVVLLSAFVLNGCDRSHAPAKKSVLSVQLIPDSATMVTAWDYPKNPLTDSSLGTSPDADEIRYGFRIFTNTTEEASRLSPNKLVCNNCHLNAGQKNKAMPLVGVAAVYPEYNKREGRVFTLADRIVGCFRRSQNATDNSTSADFPTPTSREVQALVRYVEWISDGLDKDLPWRGHNVIKAENKIPVGQLDIKKGMKLFKDKCSNCHGEDGQGVEIGNKKAGPLWGPASWNDGAGAARIYTLAGMIRYSMPYLNPGSLTDEEAQQIAAFINSKPRPAYAAKNEDYRIEKLPSDAVYYTSSSR